MDNLKLAEQKLHLLEKELILVTDPAIKFKLQHDIADLKKIITALSKSDTKQSSQNQEQIDSIELIDWLLENMKKMLPAMLEEIAFRYNVPEEYLPTNLPQASKAKEIIKYGKTTEGEQLPKLRQLVEKMIQQNFPN